MVLTRFKQFPPGPTGVLLPADSRRTAALGVCLYTASRPGVLLIQRAAFHLTRVLGTRALPGAATLLEPDIDGWEDLLSSWQKEVTPFDSLAVYRRRQQARTGLTVLLVNDGKAVAVTKVRDESQSLRREQQALDAVRRARVQTFRVPESLGAGTLDGLTWSAQTAVFDAPHRPAFTSPPSLFEEVSGALESVVDVGPGRAAAHNDLTPWNLRIDRFGTTWLFDWEDVGSAPRESDRCYFSATSHALRRTKMPGNLPPAAVDHCFRVVTARRSDSTAESNLKDAILRALDIAGRARQEQQVAVHMTA